MGLIGISITRHFLQPQQLVVYKSRVAGMHTPCDNWRMNIDFDWGTEKNQQLTGDEESHSSRCHRAKGWRM